MSSPSLGLDNSQILRLRGQSDDTNVDAILHNGAVVSMAHSFEALRKPNVEATVDFLKYELSSPRAPKFVYVSGATKMDQEPPFEILAQSLATHFGYPQTKIKSERLVLEIVSRMPSNQNRISVVKPGLIAGTADRGVVNVDDIVWHLVATSAAFKRFPEYDTDRWVFIWGVDTVAAKVVQQLFALEGMDSFVDVLDGVLVSILWNTMCEELGIQYFGEPWKMWLEAIKADALNITNSESMLSLSRLIEDDSASFPEKQPPESTGTQQVQSALRSTARYLRDLGFIRTSIGGQILPKGDMIKRTRI